MALLQTIDLKRYFGETRAVDNVNLSIEEREFVSLVGPNGAGKTSLINVISARLRPESGKIIFKGEDITRTSSLIVLSTPIPYRVLPLVGEAARGQP